MSTTYSIGCKDCKKCLWIGQQGAGSERPWLYLGDGKTDKALEAFFAAHVGHSMVFDGDYAFVDYDEVAIPNPTPIQHTGTRAVPFLRKKT